MKRFIIILSLLIVAMIGGMIYLSSTDVPVEQSSVKKDIVLPSASIPAQESDN